jgi:hypothetical protein
MSDVAKVNAPLSYNKAAIQMQKPGTRLCQMYAHGERRWYVIPGGAVSESTATKIIEQPNVIGQQDALFPGLHQTWTIVQSGQ